MGREIQFFVNSWIFGGVSLREVVERVVAIGFDGIELVGEPKMYRAEEVRPLVEDNGLKVQSICGMHPGPEEGDLRALSHPAPQERGKAVDYVRACVDLAKGVGARSVLVVPSLVGQPAHFVSREEDIRRAIESLQKAGEYAAAQDVLLTIEPINRYEVGLVYSVSDALEMARAVDNDHVRIMGDTFHMQIEEGDGIPNAIRRAGNYWLQHLHAADNTREAPGMGTMPWQEILRALHDIDYQGGVSLEPLPKGASPYHARDGKIPAEKLDAELKFGLNYLREVQKIVMVYT